MSIETTNETTLLDLKVEAERKVSKAEDAIRDLMSAGLDNIARATYPALAALRDAAAAADAAYKDSLLFCKACGATLTILDHQADVCRVHEPKNEYWEAKRDRGGVFALATLTQKVIYEEELVGQLSDGAWENTAPYDHWEPWANCRVVVDPDNVGRTFHAKKTGYAFAAQLIDCVGERMLAYARLALHYGDGVDFRVLEGYGTTGTMPTNKDSAGSDYFARIRAYLSRFDLAEVKRVAEDESLYTEKDLRRDLAAISKAMKVVR